ncbi:IclR family transcriptional regulator [Yinghuangia sp. YIM S09857]|uniref:IclR family transcriptional regulator n=1 Tax=Yinghuangia sp. YIM S09857 TaxID=3436929 RepID=UPI003F52914E
MRNRPPYPLASVDNALRLVEILRDRGRIRVSEAAEELGIGRSTAHRLLAMLAYRDFAAQDDDRGYVPGRAMTTPIGIATQTTQLFRRTLLPHLDALCDQVGETVNLMVRVGTQTRFLATVESTQVLHVGDRQGTILPAHQTSGGKALLAALPVAELYRLYALPSPNAGDTDRTSDPGSVCLAAGRFERLLHELEGVRKSGYALNMEATEAGVRAIGRRVVARSLDTVGAVSIAAPTTRMPKSRIPELADALRRMADRAQADFER